MKMQMPLKGECLKRQSFQCTLLESNFLWEGFSRFNHEYKERPQKLVQGDQTMYQTKSRIWFYPCDVGTKNERVTGSQNERIPTINMVQAMTSQASGIRCSYICVYSVGLQVSGGSCFSLLCSYSLSLEWKYVLCVILL